MARGKKAAEESKDATAGQPEGAKPSRAAGNEKLYVDQVRQFVDMMVANDLTSLEIVNGDLKVSLGRGMAVSAAHAVSPAAFAPAAPAAAAAPAAPAPAAAPAENLLEIKSPMVGTFYWAPSPDSDPYVKTGARVSSDTVVCIIEAMKVMNEIKAECAGTIVEVAVENGRPVEYGQVLFRVRP